MSDDIYPKSPSDTVKELRQSVLAKVLVLPYKMKHNSFFAKNGEHGHYRHRRLQKLQTSRYA